MWIKTNERLPDRDPKQRYSQVPCLVYYRREVAILVFNHEHMVWDDQSGDDYECDIGAVSHWMPLPSPPTADIAEGANLHPTTPQGQNAQSGASAIA
ncbi:MAG: DUF551 domain-containing protein [Candidatus Omnitrophica bacterium]|nr:DUF551 domain-containing protein [Candidatus Omnitrophota bacterium]MDD5353472.1 DUF551 domain-containing protein [Candidatus Omnitrophota bacterium]